MRWQERPPSAQLNLERTHADWPVGREDRQVCGHESTEAPAFRALTTDSLQIRACQDAWMAAIDAGAPTRKQLKADLKIMFEDFMTPQAPAAAGFTKRFNEAEVSALRSSPSCCYGATSGQRRCPSQRRLGIHCGKWLQTRVCFTESYDYDTFFYEESNCAAPWCARRHKS